MADISTCPGDCKKCSLLQHSYCAAQMSRNTQDAVSLLFNEIAALNKRLDELFSGDPVTPPSALGSLTSDAQDGEVQTIDSESINTPKS